MTEVLIRFAFTAELDIGAGPWDNNTGQKRDTDNQSSTDYFLADSNEKAETNSRRPNSLNQSFAASKTSFDGFYQVTGSRAWPSSSAITTTPFASTLLVIFWPSQNFPAVECRIALSSDGLYLHE